MIIPTKHIRLSESLIGLGSFIISKLDKPKNIDELWFDFQDAARNKIYPFTHTFMNIFRAVELLYIMGIITSNDNGELRLCKNSK